MRAVGGKPESIKLAETLRAVLYWSVRKIFFTKFPLHRVSFKNELTARCSMSDLEKTDAKDGFSPPTDSIVISYCLSTVKQPLGLMAAWVISRLVVESSELFARLC